VNARSIQSRSHPLIRRARALLRDPARRREEQAFVIEGPRLLADALAAGFQVELVLASPKSLQDPALATLLGRLRALETPVVTAGSAVLELAQDADAPRGLAAIARLPEAAASRGAPDSCRISLVAWQLQDPGNLGALMRVAEAAGGSEIICLEGGADPWHPRSIRASTGSIFRLGVRRAVASPELIAGLRASGLRILAASARGESEWTRAGLTPPFALLLGQEAAGLPAWAEDLADERVRIPLQGEVESLNVTVAAGVLLYEALRRVEAAGA